MGGEEATVDSSLWLGLPGLCDRACGNAAMLLGSRADRESRTCVTRFEVARVQHNPSQSAPIHKLLRGCIPLQGHRCRWRWTTWTSMMRHQ